MEQLFPLSWKLDDILRFLYISHLNWLSHVIELHLCPHNISWQICWCFLLGKCSHKNRTGAGVADWPGRQRKAQSRWGHNEARGGGRLKEAASVWHHSGYLFTDETGIEWVHPSQLFFIVNPEHLAWGCAAHFKALASITQEQNAEFGVFSFVLHGSPQLFIKGTY